MTGRERFMTALENKKPDRLPCQVHSWMEYYLKTYLGGMDQYAAYEKFAMDPVVYIDPLYIFAEKDLANWQVIREDFGILNGVASWRNRIVTPAGELTDTGSSNQYTSWNVEHLIKNEQDFEIWNKHVPVPVEVDWSPVIEARRKVGDRGIVRSGFFDFGQGSPWQSFCTLFGTEETIMAAMDKPDWVEYVLQNMLAKKLRAIDVAGKFKLDLIETGGGAGSSTVISPAMHRRFCLPYDKTQHKALHNAGTKVVYHLCGGLMPLLAIVMENGADALETMTPPGMGGDCDLAEANRICGSKICLIGGFDQKKGFENGSTQIVEKMVHDLFNACPDGGYICSPSDHFFSGSPENIQAFANTARQCYY